MRKSSIWVGLVVLGAGVVWFRHTAKPSVAPSVGAGASASSSDEEHELGQQRRSALLAWLSTTPRAQAPGVRPEAPQPEVRYPADLPSPPRPEELHDLYKGYAAARTEHPVVPPPPPPDPVRREVKP